jgi:hypothetical protein
MPLALDIQLSAFTLRPGSGRMLLAISRTLEIVSKIEMTQKMLAVKMRNAAD